MSIQQASCDDFGVMSLVRASRLPLMLLVDHTFNAFCIYYYACWRRRQARFHFHVIEAIFTPVNGTLCQRHADVRLCCLIMGQRIERQADSTPTLSLRF